MILSVSWFTLSARASDCSAGGLGSVWTYLAPGEGEGGGENCDEVDLDNGNLSITISQLAVHSITELPAWLPVIIYWSGRQSFQVQVGVCVRGVSVEVVVLADCGGVGGGIPWVYYKRGPSCVIGFHCAAEPKSPTTSARGSSLIKHDDVPAN